MDKQLENQCDTMVTTQTLCVDVKIPQQIFKDMPNGGGVTIQTQYILMDSYNKLKYELEKSEEQVRILHSQIRQNEKFNFLP